jgi:hypothetical protein
MNGNHRTRSRVRQWSTGAGLAAAAAAMIGMGTAHADDGSVPTDIGLLNTAQADIAEAFSLSGQTNADAGFFPELEAIQTPLLSSDDSFVSGFGEALFNSPDQQLAQASEAFLSAAETLSSDTTNLTALGDYASTGFQVTGAIFGEIPSTLIGKLTDQIFDIGGFDSASASAAADVATSASATTDDVVGQTLAAASTANQYDPAVFDYSADPSNLFAPVYTVAPVGPEEAISTVTDPNNLDTTDTFGTQDFSLSSLGFPVDTFTGNVEYTPTPFDGATGLSGILSQLSQDFGLPGGYSEEITTLGGTGTVLPDEPTSFLISEFGLGYGNVFEESMNSAGTSATVGDFILTPFGDENITPIVDLFLPQGVGITDAVDPSSFADLLSSIGL